jgi:hypothetical protein
VKTISATDLEFVRSVLARFPNPRDCYLLKFNLDATAEALEKLHDDIHDRDR